MRKILLRLFSESLRHGVFREEAWFDVNRHGLDRLDIHHSNFPKE